LINEREKLDVQGRSGEIGRPGRADKQVTGVSLT
jgi:hypothetical protein